MESIDQRLASLGIDLPEAAAPVGNYVACSAVGSLLFVSGQLPMKAGSLCSRGRVGESLSVEQAYEAARLCGLNVLAQARLALGGSLNRVVRVVRLGGFVCVAPTFADVPKCINGASDLMVEVFGENGKHARFAVGVNSLPGMASVEVDATLEILKC